MQYTSGLLLGGITWTAVVLHTAKCVGGFTDVTYLPMYVTWTFYAFLPYNVVLCHALPALKLHRVKGHYSQLLKACAKGKSGEHTCTCASSVADQTSPVLWVGVAMCHLPYSQKLLWVKRISQYCHLPRRFYS